MVLQMLKLTVSPDLWTKYTDLGVKLVHVVYEQMQTLLWIKSLYGPHFISKSRITAGNACLVIANVDVFIDSKCGLRL